MLLYDRAVVLRAFMIGYIALRGLLLRKSGLLRLRVYGLRRGEGINRLLIGGLTIGHLPLLRREGGLESALLHAGIGALRGAGLCVHLGGGAIGIHLHAGRSQQIHAHAGGKPRHGAAQGEASAVERIDIAAHLGLIGNAVHHRDDAVTRAQDADGVAAIGDAAGVDHAGGKLLGRRALLGLRLLRLLRNAREGHYVFSFGLLGLLRVLGRAAIALLGLIALLQGRGGIGGLLHLRLDRLLRLLIGLRLIRRLLIGVLLIGRLRVGLLIGRSLIGALLRLRILGRLRIGLRALLGRGLLLRLGIIARIAGRRGGIIGRFLLGAGAVEERIVGAKEIFNAVH